MSNKFENHIGIIFVLTLFLTLGNIFYFYLNLFTIRDNEHWINHTLIVKSTLSDTLQAVIDTETSERGYLLSGDKKFLTPYYAALPKIQDDIKNLKTLTSDNPNQQKRIPQLAKIVNLRVNFLHKAIFLRQEHGLNSTEVFNTVGQGRIIMIQVRQLIKKMQDEEDMLLQKREITSANDYRWIYLTSAVAGLLNLFLLVSAYFLIKKELQKRNEIKKVIETSEKRFKSLIEHSYEAIGLIDKNNILIYASASTKKILGYTPKEYLKLNRFTRFRPEDGKMIKQLYSTIKPRQTIEKTFQFKHKSGKWIWIESIFTNFFQDKDINAIVVNFRDVTEKKELEKRKDEFISMASHELKTPITSMKMFLDILQKQASHYNDGKVEKYIQTLKDQANKLRGLTADLLDVSRIETGKLSFNQEEFDLNTVIKENIEGLQPVMNKHTIIFENNKSIIVYADKFRIFQVLTNLLTNASKYSPKANKIIITCKRTRHEGIVSVKDFGIGIVKEQHIKIFDKLYQVTDPEEKTFPGLGMGLYISKEIIERHGGKIWIKSIKGRGSTFYFSLPLKR